MPRIADPVRAAEQPRQARWRRGLCERGRPGTRGRPESSAVDVALAAAVTAYADAARQARACDRRAVIVLVAAALDLLAARGYDRAECKRAIRSRLNRKDLGHIAEIAKIAARTAVTQERPTG